MTVWIAFNCFPASQRTSKRYKLAEHTAQGCGSIFYNVHTAYLTAASRRGMIVPAKHHNTIQTSPLSSPPHINNAVPITSPPLQSKALRIPHSHPTLNPSPHPTVPSSHYYSQSNEQTPQRSSAVSAAYNLLVRQWDVCDLWCRLGCGILSYRLRSSIVLLLRSLKLLLL